MSETLIAVKPEIAAKAHVTAESYRAMAARAQDDPDGFWAEQARRLAWMKRPTKGSRATSAATCMSPGSRTARSTPPPTASTGIWPTRGDQVAIIWEGDDPAMSRRVTYRELHEQVCRLANVLKHLGVKKGDRVCIYLPMVVEAAVAMLACARIGAVHSVVFGGFSPDSLADRIRDCRRARADHRRRGPARRAQGRAEGQRRRGAEARAPASSTCWWSRVTGGTVPMQHGRDHGYDDAARHGLARLRAGGDGRRGPAVHPLHLRQHRQAEGRAAHHRRLHGLGDLHA